MTLNVPWLVVGARRTEYFINCPTGVFHTVTAISRVVNGSKNGKISSGKCVVLMSEVRMGRWLETGKAVRITTCNNRSQQNGFTERTQHSLYYVQST